MEMDEMEIDLISLFRYLLRKWKVIVLAIIVFALGADAVYVVKQHRNMPTSDVTVELSADEQDGVDDALVLYQAYASQRDSYMDYYENSVLVNMDPNQASQEVLSYIVTGQEQGQVESFVSLVRSYIYTDDNYQLIASSMDYDAKWVSELITVSSAASDITTASSQTVTITVVAPSQDECTTMADLVHDIANEAMENAALQMTSCQYAYADSRYTETTLWNYMTLKSDTYQKYMNAKNSMALLTENMSENQVTYFTAATESLESGESLETAKVAGANALTREAETIDYISIKMVAIGAFVGLFLVCVCYGMYYIMNGKLKVKSDMVYLGISEVLGDQVSISDMYQDDKRKQMVELLALMASKENKKSLLLASSLATQEVAELMNQLSKELQVKSSGLKVTTCINFAFSMNGVAQLEETDSVVMLEQIMVSKYDAISREVKLCAQCQVPVMGALVLK